MLNSTSSSFSESSEEDWKSKDLFDDSDSTLYQTGKNYINIFNFDFILFNYLLLIKSFYNFVK
jgi:hypothetical protein